MIQRAVILAAGLGTRLKWLTERRPKALLPVAGKPAIAHVIERLVASGVRDIAVNAHHHAEQLQNYLQHGERFGCRIQISHETALLDSAGGVKQALQFLPGSGAFFIHNADILSDIDLRQLARATQRYPQQSSLLALVANPPHHPQGDFQLAGHHLQVIAPHAAATSWTFAGVSVWDEHSFDTLPSGEPCSLLPLIHQQIAAKRCYGYIHRHHWFDIGRPADLMRAHRFFAIDAYK